MLSFAELSTAFDAHTQEGRRFGVAATALAAALQELSQLAGAERVAELAREHALDLQRKMLATARDQYPALVERYGLANVLPSPAAAANDNNAAAAPASLFARRMDDALAEEVCAGLLRCTDSARPVYEFVKARVCCFFFSLCFGSPFFFFLSDALFVSLCAAQEKHIDTVEGGASVLLGYFLYLLRQDEEAGTQTRLDHRKLKAESVSHMNIARRMVEKCSGDDGERSEQIVMRAYEKVYEFFGRELKPQFMFRGLSCFVGYETVLVTVESLQAYGESHPTPVGKSVAYIVSRLREEREKREKRRAKEQQKEGE